MPDSLFPPTAASWEGHSTAWSSRCRPAGSRPPLVVAMRPHSNPPELALPIDVPDGEIWPEWVCLGNATLKRGEPWPYSLVRETDDARASSVAEGGLA